LIDLISFPLVIFAVAAKTAGHISVTWLAVWRIWPWQHQRTAAKEEILR